MTKTEHMELVERMLGFKRKVIENVMILGGGRLGYYIATTSRANDCQGENY